ncbi:B-type cyclin [Malassezia sp. CBS 17886]|nr:B-type cyclin [Malassezia sp. CBS 17886]
MDHATRHPADRARPLRLGAGNPSLVPPNKQIAAAQRPPRPALADVSNRDPLVRTPRRAAHTQYAVPPGKPREPTRTALRRAATELRPARHETAKAAHAAPAVRAADAAHDVSMSTDVSLVEYNAPGPTPAHDARNDTVAASASFDSLRSDDSDALAALELDVDPAGVVTLPLEHELAAQQRVAEVCAQYEKTVLVPQALAAQAERAELVRRGEMDAVAAQLDDEMMQLGLDPEETRDASMVAEYTADIFAYMASCERESMPNPNYMDFQDEIQWHMRATLIDWLLQVHMRYHMLPETLWIAVNLVDRFLSARIVSLAKLQLVGVTAMFVASKYEEILAPSVEEFVFMTENGYSREEILKGERIVLSTLDFNVSTYCSPYTWVRRISKADDYDIQTRTLCKFLMEVTLLNHLFLRARPSLIAAVGMYVAKRMLGGAWDDAFVFYSRFSEEQLVPGANLVLEKLVEPGFEEQFVYKKYAGKKFLKASMYARSWALRNHSIVVAAHASYAPAC